MLIHKEYGRRYHLILQTIELRYTEKHSYFSPEIHRIRNGEGMIALAIWWSSILDTIAV